MAAESISQDPPLPPPPVAEALAVLAALSTGDESAAVVFLCALALFGLPLDEGFGGDDAPAAAGLLRMSSTLVFSLLISGMSPSVYLRMVECCLNFWKKDGITSPTGTMQIVRIKNE